MEYNKICLLLLTKILSFVSPRLSFPSFPLPTSHFLLLTKRGGNKSVCVPVTLHIFQGQNAFAVGLDENTDKRERARPRQNGTRWVTQHMVVLHHPHKPDWFFFFFLFIYFIYINDRNILISLRHEFLNVSQHGK